MPSDFRTNVGNIGGHAHAWSIGKCCDSRREAEANNRELRIGARSPDMRPDSRTEPFERLDVRTEIETTPEHGRQWFLASPFTLVVNGIDAIRQDIYMRNTPHQSKGKTVC